MEQEDTEIKVETWMAVEKKLEEIRLSKGQDRGGKYQRYTKYLTLTVKKFWQYVKKLFFFNLLFICSSKQIYETMLVLSPR